MHCFRFYAPNDTLRPRPACSNMQRKLNGASDGARGNHMSISNKSQAKRRPATGVAMVALTVGLMTSANAAQAASDTTAAPGGPTPSAAPIVLADASAAGASDSGDIVVTAQRRAQSTMDVGINVTAIAPQRLKEEKIDRIGELIQATSNLEVREIRPGGGQPAITIRGVGMNDFTVASNPSTAVYFDGVYSPNIGTISQQFFDLGQVEVLKGPQSSLYGRNATAGAITISSAAPTDMVEGYITGGYGNYKAFDAEGAIGGPIANGLTGRLSVKTRQSYAGWIKNTLPGGDDFGEIHQVSVRGQLKWTDGGRFTLHGIFAYQHEDDQPGAFTVFGRRVPGGRPGATTALCPVALANQIDFGNSCASLFGSVRPSTDVRTIAENDSWRVKGETYTGTLLGTYEGDGFAIRSVTSYLHWKEIYHKSDSLPITEQNAILDQRTWQISEDLQIASTGHRRLGWMAGVYLSSANTNNPTYTIAPINGGNYIGTNDADTKTAQAYAQLDYELTPRLTVNVGGRFLYEHDNKVGGTWFDTNQNRIVDAGDRNQAFLDDAVNQTAFTWKVGLNYKPDNSTLFYGSVTHGFKSGGFIAPAVATSTSQLLPYKGENIYAFEVGAKKSLFDRMLDVSTSLFYYDYHDLQTNQQQFVGNLLVNRFANVPHAHIKGLDFEAVLRPVTGLELRADAGLIDTWVGAFSSGGIAYAPGNKFANAPTFSGTGSVRYQFRVTDGYELALGASVHRQSKIYPNTENAPLFRIDSDATLVSAQAQLILTDTGWSAMAWVKNLTNTAYTNSTYQTGSTVNTLYNAPRMYGVSLTRRF